VRLREVNNSLTPSKRKVADFTLQHLGEMIVMSVAELASSSSAVRRLLRGYAMRIAANPITFNIGGYRLCRIC
jgi:hypothetical protein